MEDADASVPGSAAARDSPDRRPRGSTDWRGGSVDAGSPSLPVSELSPPPGELQEENLMCHICLVRSRADQLIDCKLLL